MDRLIEALQQQLLPAAAHNAGRILPRRRLGQSAVADQGFIEAYPYATHSHTYFEGMWLLRGSAHMKIDGEIHALQPNDFCLLPPRVLHADLYNKSTPPYESLWFSYRPEMVNAHLFRYEPLGQWHSVTYSQVSSGPAIAGILLSLQSELAEEHSHSELVCRALLVQLAAWLLRAIENAASLGDRQGPGHASQRALAYLRSHYAEGVTLGDVARAAYLSPHYLASVFKQETGITVMDALTEIRLAHARRLLLEGRHGVGEIAAAVGYSSPHHFSRLFRRASGIPPSLYGK